MNLGDPELEYIDPTPNVHALFVHFDNLFFWTKLAGRALVRWSKRMYSCAGTCSYEGCGGVCDIALSEPLLKLRPRKDLIETLLHEMIHAYLFVMNRDQDRNGHGPNFLSHMHRINKSAGLNISVYHDFHDEVKLYQTHWWRCNGPCQKMKPYFGIVRATCNRAPGPFYYWWDTHKRKCGGTFIKIKEPEKKEKTAKDTKAVKTTTPNADITKYIKNKDKVRNENNANKINTINTIKKVPNVQNEKKNSPNTLVINKVGTPKSKPIVKPGGTTIVKPTFIGGGKVNPEGRVTSISIGVIETVRNVWANKQIPTVNATMNKPTSTNATTNSPISTIKTNKHKTDVTESPPSKKKKIDDYFKSTATSILKDLYGKDFKIVQEKNEKPKAIIDTQNYVNCPICNEKVISKNINTHVDECLNKDVIERLSKENITPQGSNRTVPQNPTVKTEVKTEIDDNNANEYKEICNLVKDLENRRKATVIVPKTDEEFISCKDLENRRKTTIIVPKTDEEVISCCPNIKIEPSTSKESTNFIRKESNLIQECPCCGNMIDKPVQEHLDECLAFFDNNNTAVSEPGTSAVFDSTIVLDDDNDDENDEFNETQTLNPTGTKSPCPCCLKMIEISEMNDHLDSCLSS